MDGKYVGVHEDPGVMVKSVDEHLDDILATVAPAAPIHLPISEATGCLLAERVTAPDALPAFDNSALDGYAVRAADLACATEDEPVTLPVVTEIAAGSAGLFTVRRGMCTRIMTGAPMPAGADAVVPVEWTDGGTSRVTVTRAPAEADAIRRRGEDVRPGDVVLEPGVPLTPPRIGLLAAVGRARVFARPRPRVVVMSTGSELVEPGDEMRPGQLVDTNSYTLAAAATAAGAVVYRHGVVGDKPGEFLDAVRDQLARADVLVTSGGVSMGAHDVVKDVLGELGTVRFERVAMQPGMPQGFGTVYANPEGQRPDGDGTPVFALPGNPVSAYVSFQVFARPALRRVAGFDPRPLPTVTAQLGGELTSSNGKRSFERARLSRDDAGGYRVSPVGGRGSHLLARLAEADALVVVPEDITHLDAGEAVAVLPLEGHDER